MTGGSSEQAAETYRGLDGWPAERIVAAIIDSQRAAIDAVASALPAIAMAAEAVAARIEDGGRIVYIGAGSSGLIALADALELPGTFGLNRDRVEIVLAGGVASLNGLDGAAEDDEAAGVAAIGRLAVTARDAVVAVSASGSTPFTVAAFERARDHGALSVAFANNCGTRLLGAADHRLLLPTGPEVVAGSTRLGAGTAQKCALNALSTLVGVRLGHVFDGLMVNLQAENDKLRRRALAIVASGGACGPDLAATALQAADGDVKAAIVALRLHISPAAARHLLAAGRGNIRAAIAMNAAPP